MGDPKKTRKKYDTPGHPYQKVRIEEENKLVMEYGLKNKRELWKANSELRKYRLLARTLLGDRSEHKAKVEKELIAKLVKLGVLKEGATLDDILSLTVTDFLDRRLQTFVFKKAVANTMKQARQFIVHGKIGVSSRRINVPSYKITVADEEKIAFYGKPVEIEQKTQDVIVPAGPETKPAVVAPETKPAVPSTKPSVPIKGPSAPAEVA